MNQLARYIVALAVAAVVCFLAWYFSDILTYILIAAVISIIGRPLMAFFDSLHIRNWRLPRSLSAALTLLTLMSVFVALFALIVPLASQIFIQMGNIDMSRLAENLANPLESINHFIHKYIPDSGSDITVESIFSQQITNFLYDFDFGKSFNSLAAALMHLGVGIFVVCFVTFFFIKEKDMFNNIVLSLFPDKHEEHASRALRSVNHLLVRYFLGICVEILAITVLNTLGLVLICGFDWSLAVVLAFASGVLNVIPYIGPVVGGLIGVFTGIIGYYDPVNNPGIILFVLPVVLVYTVTHIIDLFIFQPYIYSNSVKAHPLEIFMVILVAGSIGGMIGMLVAIPAYTVLRVFAQEFFYNFKVVQKLTRGIIPEE